MKFRKILASLADILDADRREQLKREDELVTLLDRLDDKHRRLREELDTTHDRKREKIRSRLAILEAERRKGIQALEEIRSTGKRDS